MNKRLQSNTTQLAIGFEPTLPTPFKPSVLPWIIVKKGNPYFYTESGAAWTPIGQNDAITWPDLTEAFNRKNRPAVAAYLDHLVQHGVTCLRLMLEYCHSEHRYFENPAGHFKPSMVQLWDDLFALCEARQLRILLTPYDTFWMWRRWRYHPYNVQQGGPCARRTQWLTCSKTRAAIKARLLFATQRWGGSGALFAWDLWNEIQPKQGGGDANCIAPFIEDISQFLRQTEVQLHGRAHPQTVSFFCPTLDKHPELMQTALMHPSLDFASLHFYEKGTIDAPKTSAAAALAAGRLTRNALQTIRDNRPFLDSEHGPIHTFSVRRKTLPETFDDVYFRHMQWAHLAAGGAGGGMRWPYRHPHTLTPGMRVAQQGLAGFVPLLNWSRFQRKNLNAEVEVNNPAPAIFACGDASQAIVWLLRQPSKKTRGNKKKVGTESETVVNVPCLQKGCYTITFWNTETNTVAASNTLQHNGDAFFAISLPTDFAEVALAITLKM